MDWFEGKLAVVTGGGSGMGRELVCQLAAQGCSVAACDLNADAVAQTAVSAGADALPGVRVSAHECDVADEAQVLRFRDELLGGHARPKRRPSSSTGCDPEPGESSSARTPRRSTRRYAPNPMPLTTTPSCSAR
jgi:short chain dehydrogenase